MEVKISLSELNELLKRANINTPTPKTINNQNSI